MKATMKYGGAKPAASPTHGMQTHCGRIPTAAEVNFWGQQLWYRTVTMVIICLYAISLCLLTHLPSNVVQYFQIQTFLSTFVNDERIRPAKTRPGAKRFAGTFYTLQSGEEFT
jgi:hypothetical protein